ncbi:hypothetical protein [Ruegeria arenilitoris]|nr:hypothetical protein [Ruegeria arenilitoris]
MKNLIAISATLLVMSVPAFAGEEENKAAALRALTGCLMLRTLN